MYTINEEKWREGLKRLYKEALKQGWNLDALEIGKDHVYKINTLHPQYGEHYGHRFISVGDITINKLKYDNELSSYYDLYPDVIILKGTLDEMLENLRNDSHVINGIGYVKCVKVFELQTSNGTTYSKGIFVWIDENAFQSGLRRNFDDSR